MIRDKIIIVEDDPGISKYLQAALRSHGYDILLAPDGKTALEMIASHCPDVLLLDLGLPDMDGSEIIRSVRTWSRMPIIIISARSAEIDKAAALDMGADDYLTKPSARWSCSRASARRCATRAPTARATVWP